MSVLGQRIIGSWVDEAAGPPARDPRWEHVWAEVHTVTQADVEQGFYPRSLEGFKECRLAVVRHSQRYACKQLVDPFVQQLSRCDVVKEAFTRMIRELDQHFDAIEGALR